MIKNIYLLFHAMACYRKKHGISAKQICYESGIPMSHISEMEAGKIDVKLSTFIRYLDAVGYEVKLCKKQ